jgi:uncharacterized membrane protein YfcA
MSILLAGLTGMVAGSSHVVSGPDHLAAVMPLAVEKRWKAAITGAWWGVGHAIGVLVLGVAGHLLAGWLDIEVLSAWSEGAVGVLLIGLGSWTLWRVSHPSPDGHTHSHRGAFGIGFLHGTAGAGHLFGVLPTLGMGAGDAAVYLGAYMLAAVGSMSLFALGVGLLARNRAHVPWALRIAGGAAILIGVAWIALAV